MKSGREAQSGQPFAPSLFFSISPSSVGLSPRYLPEDRDTHIGHACPWPRTRAKKENKEAMGAVGMRGRSAVSYRERANGGGKRQREEMERNAGLAPTEDAVARSLSVHLPTLTFAKLNSRSGCSCMRQGWRSRRSQRKDDSAFLRYLSFLRSFLLIFSQQDLYWRTELRTKLLTRIYTLMLRNT